ncbi:40S ribosomal protein S17 [Psilocybe cubensis]|uniref:40S ribosomal protein S17 n=1 Tax=Psilocybe cubensis TaxID=181762 RepID=A0ACB8GIK6_PSICU|nr:40S ribosomal protein S17 [Psilocybe cubensis]KAH9474904.1 40S ribosomal protein S17 [Psilocybe cubensis]
MAIVLYRTNSATAEFAGLAGQTAAQFSAAVKTTLLIVKSLKEPWVAFARKPPRGPPESSSKNIVIELIVPIDSYPRLTLDFHTNKRIIDEVAVVPSKRLRNKISGFTTHLMKRIQRGPVRGISFKLQEEERERKDNYVPEVSALDTSAGLEVDPDTKALLESLNFDSIPVNVIVPVLAAPERGPRRSQRAVPGAART